MRKLGLLLLVACGVPPKMVETPPPPVMMEPPPKPVSHADGTLGPWEQQRALPTARANHCAAAFGDFLIVAGGNYKPLGATDFVTLDDVQISRTDSVGALLPWKLAGRLPGPATECVLAVSGHTVMLLGGLFADSDMNMNVWTATLSDDGTLGAWSVVGTTPYHRRPLGMGAAFDGFHVWLSDSKLSSEGTEEAAIFSATLDNVLSVWTPSVYGAGFRGKPLGVFAPEAAFVIGGYLAGNMVTTDVTAVPLTGAPASTTPLPEGRAFGAAVFVDGYVFATGGRTQILGVPPSPATYSSAVSGATLGAWTPQRSLPEARSNHVATVVGDFLFITGGGNTGGGLDTVFSARVKFVPPTQ